MDDDFINEDDLLTFDGWVRFQGVDPATSTPEEIKMMRRLAASSKLHKRDYAAGLSFRDERPWQLGL